MTASVLHTTVSCFRTSYIPAYIDCCPVLLVGWIPFTNTGCRHYLRKE